MLHKLLKIIHCNGLNGIATTTDLLQYITRNDGDGINHNITANLVRSSIRHYCINITRNQAQSSINNYYINITRNLVQLSVVGHCIIITNVNGVSDGQA